MTEKTNLLGILFRCDASPEIGMGHVVRCLALADVLREKYSVGVGFAMRNGELGFEIVKRAGYPVFPAPEEGSLDYGAWLKDAMKRLGASLIFVDVRDDLSRPTLAELKSENYVVAALDDSSERRLAADLAFYSPVPQVTRADWKEFKGQKFVGWEWTILRAQFRQPVSRSPTRTQSKTQGKKCSLLVAMGGTDPAGLTLQAVRALDRLAEEFETRIVLGAGFQHRPVFEKILEKASRKFLVQTDVSDMRTVMAECDLAVCSFGMTAYELAAMGVPAIYLCLTPDHAESASAFADAGMGWSLGVFSEVGVGQLAEATERLIRDSALREKMSVRAQALMDGDGADRIAKILIEAASKNSRSA
jgi:spore coat polysaccharide biosynthesis predicted glycosyltransferase SpsG